MSGERILFVTGRLAEFSLRNVIEPVSRDAGFCYEVAVLGITVAALMHTEWVARKLPPPRGFDRVVLPGWCSGDVDRLGQTWGIRVERGPKSLYDLPQHFGQHAAAMPVLDDYDIEILAEINHADALSDKQIITAAAAFKADGADVIDLGCRPGQTWPRAGEVTALLCAEGFRVSIDSFDRAEVEAAVDGGGELVLSCNGHNLEWLLELGVEVVAIPDEPGDDASLERTVDRLAERGTPFRIDPILEPIGFGFAESLHRYQRARQRWPDREMLMGVGNLTELTEVDSAGVNFLLAAICQEWGIRSVLTTQVINWAKSSVREFDLARRQVAYCLRERVLPKHLDSGLVLLRDPRVIEMGDAALSDLARRLKDPNFRIFVESGRIHVMNRDGYWHGTDPFELMDRVWAETGGSSTVDATHAFYLGYEMSKAATALTLGKQYQQDEALHWGFLTVSEISAVERRKSSQAD